MILASWNVNGLRAVIKKGVFLPFINNYKIDIIGLQEIKIDADKIDKENFNFPGYVTHYNSAKRPGYSGTAILVNNKLAQPTVTTGIGGDKKFSVQGAAPAGFGGQRPASGWDSEGRVQTLEFSKFYFVNVYFPNSREDLSRIDFKADFNNALLKHIQKLEKGSAKKAGKPVVLTGDYNVAHNPIDLARPKENEGKHGYHPKEREWFSKLLTSGFVDTFRSLHPTTIKYSWWSTRFGQKARINNVGWRIDYFCVSKSLIKKVKKADILDQVTGSDHCPVTLDLDI